MLFFRVIPCLVVAVQTYMKWIPISFKKTRSRRMTPGVWRTNWTHNFDPWVWLTRMTHDFDPRESPMSLTHENDLRGLRDSSDLAHFKHFTRTFSKFKVEYFHFRSSITTHFRSPLWWREGWAKHEKLPV